MTIRCRVLQPTSFRGATVMPGETIEVAPDELNFMVWWGRVGAIELDEGQPPDPEHPLEPPPPGEPVQPIAGNEAPMRTPVRRAPPR